MLGIYGAPVYGNVIQTISTASTTNYGSPVTPGASNAEGSWTTIHSAGNITNDIYFFYLYVTAGATSGAVKNHLLDIGVDPAGGTSFTPIISNLVCGQSGPSIPGQQFAFPLYIKSGSTLGARIKGSNSTAGTVRVGFDLFGTPEGASRHLIKTGTFTETIGTITNSLGVLVIPGNSTTEGSWVELGTTTRELWHWQLGIQCNNGTTTQLGYAWDLAYGDGSTKVPIITNYITWLPGTSEITNNRMYREGYKFVPAGSTIYVRGNCSGTAVTGWNAVCVGTGG